MAANFVRKRTTLRQLRRLYLCPLLVHLLLACMFVPAHCVSHSLATNAESAERSLAAKSKAAQDDFLLYQLAAAINSYNSQDNGEVLEKEVVEEVEEHWESWQEWQNWSHSQHKQNINGDNLADLLDWLAVNYEITTNDIYRAFRMRNSEKPATLCNAKGRCYKLKQLSKDCCAKQQIQTLH